MGCFFLPTPSLTGRRSPFQTNGVWGPSDGRAGSKQCGSAAVGSKTRRPAQQVAAQGGEQEAVGGDPARGLEHLQRTADEVRRGCGLDQRRQGGVGQAHTRAGLRPPCAADAPVHGLDRRPPLPVRRLARPPAGLAGGSCSRRPPSRIVCYRRARLRVPTHHLSGMGTASRLGLGSGGKNTPWMTKPKKSLCSATELSRRWCWNLCPAANSPGALKRSPRATTTSPIPAAARCRWTHCWTGLCAIARTDSPLCPP